MNTIDRRKTYILVLDVETANTLDDALVYDFGFVVADKHGNIYERESLVIPDVYIDYADLMQTAYYSEKLPQYNAGLKSGDWTMRTLYNARNIIHRYMEEYGITEVWAYNCHFDRNALDKTLRYITKSKFRWFFPYGTEFHCIWNFACDTLFQQKSFFKMANEKGWVSEKGNPKTSAEIAYRYIKGADDFDESHTGLSDVLIETEILAKCFRQHKKADTNIKRNCWQKVAKSYREWARA